MSCPTIISTPWGPSNIFREFGDGILAVTTPSGQEVIFVPRQLYDNMPPPLRCNVLGGGTWFTMDSNEWLMVVLAFPHLFLTDDDREYQIIQYAITVIKGYSPANYGCNNRFAEAGLWTVANEEAILRLCNLSDSKFALKSQHDNTLFAKMLAEAKAALAHPKGNQLDEPTKRLVAFVGAVCDTVRERKHLGRSL